MLRLRLESNDYVLHMRRVIVLFRFPDGCLSALDSRAELAQVILHERLDMLGVQEVLKVLCVYEQLLLH